MSALTTRAAFDLFWKERYGRSVMKHISDRINEGISYRKIAAEVSDMSGLQVSHAAISRWYDAAQAETAAA